MKTNFNKQSIISVIFVFIYFFYTVDCYASSANNNYIVNSSNKDNLRKLTTENKVRYISDKSLFIIYDQKFNNFKASNVKNIKIIIEDNNINQDLSFIYSNYLNKYMDEDKMQELAKKLYQFYIEKGYLLPNIKIIKQDIESGLLSIKISFDNITKVILNKDDNNELLKEYIKKILDSKPARIKDIERYVRLINQIPGYNVEYQLKQSFINGERESNLILDIHKVKVVANVSADNYGFTSTGLLNESINISLFSPFEKNDSITFLGSSTNQPGRLSVLGFKYDKPINSYGTTIRFSFLDVSVNTSIKDNGIKTPDSKYLTIASALRQDIYLDSRQALVGQLYNVYRSSKSYYIDSNNESAVDVNARYQSAGSTLEYTLDDHDSRNNIKLSIESGFSGTYEAYSDPTFIYNTKYTQSILSASRNQKLHSNFSLFISASAARINFNAPAELIFGLGGQQFARGYEAGTLTGGKLAASSLEVRYDKKFSNHEALTNIQPYAFYDYGYLGTQTKTITYMGIEYENTNISSLSSYGAGLRTSFKYDIKLSMEVAVPLKDSFMVDGTSYNVSPRATFMISKSYKY